MFQRWIELAKNKMFGKLEKELDEGKYTGIDEKVIGFLVKTLPKFLTSIMIFLGMLYIFNTLYDKYGIERVMIGIGIILILTLRGILKTLNKATDD